MRLTCLTEFRYSASARSAALGLLLAVGLAATLARAQDDLHAQEEAAIKQAAQSVAPSVVRIETFGGTEKVGDVLVSSGPTTGLVVSEDGYILSSAFNFVQKPSSILVTLPSGKRAAAQIVARDHSRMLVLLKVSTDETLTVPTAVPRDEMQVGQWTIAVGRTYEQALPSISVGVLSAKNRIWGKAIQSDAKISPSNYGGPLVDIRGRVLGILVPLSPMADSEVAGAEWYDSGIGFAVPLADILPRLEQLKQGKDLHPGLLGVSLKGNNVNADPALLVGCHPRGPADKAGLKAQDRIIEVDGQPVARQGELKHILGTRYAGDTVQVVALRGSERVEVSIELAAKLEPFVQPMLGILPRRATKEAGVVVRQVLEGTPAAEAGLAAGDRITAIGESEIKDAAAAAEALAALEPGNKINVTYVRGDDEKTVELTLAALVGDIPAEHSPAHEELDAAAMERPAVGTVEIKIPEEQNECAAYVPEKYHPDAPHGLLVVLHAAGSYDRDQLIGRYKPICDRHELILLLPRSADAARWTSGDVAFIKKAIDDVLTHYNVDRGRIVTTGYQSGGAIAWLTALAHQDLVRGVAAVESAFPTRASVPQGEPARRYWYYSASSSKSPQKKEIDQGLERIRERKHPLVVRETGASPRELTDEERAELGRWLDSLDRL